MHHYIIIFLYFLYYGEALLSVYTNIWTRNARTSTKSIDGALNDQFEMSTPNKPHRINYKNLYHSILRPHGNMKLLDSLNIPTLSTAVSLQSESDELTNLFDPTMDSPFKQDIGKTKTLSSAKIIEFLRSGHVFTKGLFKPSFISDLRNDIDRIYEEDKLEAYRHKLRVVAPELPKDINELTIEECEKLVSETIEDYPFMQLFNIWMKSSVVRSLALNPALGKIAAELLG